MTCVFENLELHRPAKLRYGFVVASSPQTLLSEFGDSKNWNFEGLTDEHDIHACMLWEYARQSNFMRDLELRWEEPCIQQLSIQERHRLLPFRGSMVFPFPDTPWRKLQTKTKERFIKSAIPIQVFVHPAVESVAEEIERVKTESRKKQSQYRFIEITPDTWSLNTNEEIRAFFNEKIIGLRPIDIPNPQTPGRRYRDMKIALRRLGAMRLIAVYPFKEAVKLAEDNFPERDWKDREYWAGIRPNCKKKLRSLFPFLPPGEEERSFAPWQ